MADLPASPALRRVFKGSLCSGCGGCAMVAPDKITMELSAPGYLRPLQAAPLTPSEETMITGICPGLGQTVIPGDRTDDVLWGPYKTMTVGWATAPDLRYAASSGGALSAVLVHLLDSGQVDGVVQIRASETNPVANESVVSRSAAEIQAAAGSRYAPSAPLSITAPLVNDGGKYAFVGKPCDVAAMRALQERDPEVAKAFPVLVSFFCGGIPSQAGADMVVKALGVDADDLASFRYRGNGWPGKATATRRDGSQSQMTYAESWGNVLSHHVQHRCKICPDGSGKAADIVCADAWEVDDKGYPLFEEEDGISLIVARTDLGDAIISDTVAAEKLEMRPFDMTDLPVIQKGQFWRRRVILPRVLALRLMGKPAPKFKGLNLWGVQKFSSPVLFGRNFIGMIRRIVKKRM